MRKKVVISCLCLLMAGLIPVLQAGRAIGQASPSQSQTGVRPGGPVSFQRELVPLFRDSCTMCHQGDNPMGALVLTRDDAYDNLVGIQSAGAQMLRVDPGKPERSYLYYKTSGKNAAVKGSGFGMPWGQTLPPEQVDLIRRWIAQGANNN